MLMLMLMLAALVDLLHGESASGRAGWVGAGARSVPCVYVTTFERSVYTLGTLHDVPW